MTALVSVLSWSPLIIKSQIFAYTCAAFMHGPSINLCLLLKLLWVLFQLLVTYMNKMIVSANVHHLVLFWLSIATLIREQCSVCIRQATRILLWMPFVSLKNVSCDLISEIKWCRARYFSGKVFMGLLYPK